MVGVARGVVGAVVAVLGATAGAAAGDFLVYPPTPPPISDPIYAPVTLVTGDAAGAAGWWGGDGAGAFEVIGTGRVNVPLAGGAWNMTAEVYGSASFEDPTFTEFAGAAHLFHRTSQFAHGVFVSGAAYGAGGYSGTELGLGIEGAAFMPNSALVGRLGYFTGNDGDSYDYWFAQGIGRYYVTPNTKLAGIVGWFSDPGSFMLAAGAEHLFEGTSVSAFGRAAWFDNDSTWEAVGGARFFFKQPGTTLEQHDRDIPFSEATVVNF